MAAILPTMRECLELLQAQTGMLWVYEKCLDGGSGSAHLARQEDGSRVVLKLSRPHLLEAHVARCGELRRLRDLGYPAPEHLDPVLLGDDVVLRAQRWIEGGSSQARLTHTLLDDVLHANDLQAGFAPDGAGWTDFLRQTLTEGADGWCLHLPLRAWDSRSARLLDRVQAVASVLDGLELPTTDFVHLDLHVGNLLQADDRLVAIVDCGGARAGDRAFDLFTLHYMVTLAECESAVAERLAELCQARIGEAAHLAYGAHMALRVVDWAIRNQPGQVDRWLDVADRHVPA